MEIAWLGGTAFRIGGDRGGVVCDPLAGTSPTDPRILGLDVWTFSLPAPDDAVAASRETRAFVVDGPGEYEVKGVFVLGVHVPGPGGGDAPRATAYAITIDDLTVGHFGALGRSPAQEQLEALGAVDILILPVGDPDGVGPAEAVEIVNLLEPTLLVPMRYRTESEPHLVPLERFLEEMGAAEPEVVASLQVTRSRLPLERQIVRLAHAGT